MDENVLKALCEPKRYQLLQFLAERSYCVSALAYRSGLSESAVSQHLKILREAGLVCGVKRGYYTHYGLDQEMLGKVIAQLEQLRTARCIPCEKPFYGCSEAEFVRCKAYVPTEEREGR